jgi:hypothetical protein
MDRLLFYTKIRLAWKKLFGQMHYYVGAMTFSLKALSIIPFGIKSSFAILSINNTQYK